MFDNVVETVERARDPKNEGFGCILAHFMVIYCVEVFLYSMMRVWVKRCNVLRLLKHIYRTRLESTFLLLFQ
eukprot:UN20592